LQKEDLNKNIFISPLSISIALSMTYNGAGGTTKQAMTNVLQFSGLSLQQVNEGYKNLIESLENVDSQVSLSIGDSVWIKDTFEPLVKIPFKNALTSYFGSEVYSRQFSDPKTVNEINSWISRMTNGKIEKMLNQIDPEMVMFLINAIYFKGDWVTKFDEAKTSQSTFTLIDGSKVSVSMMKAVEKFLYYSDKNVQVARLPYGRDKVAMYVILPKEGVSLDTYINSLDQVSLDKIFSSMSSTELDMQLPKLKLEYGKKALKDALTKLGMGVAFDRIEADLTGIALPTMGNLFISFVDHKAVIEINEKGTEAAAATNVGIGLTSIPLRTSFTVNRPYMFVIRDDRSGTLLFTGKITDPTQQTSP
ncbi:serpin family protein, partial [Candidatus Bathyarchaeota archaeon]|nr:serpin family protein [Candidatus Bathyarchaeota archaeon]